MRRRNVDFLCAVVIVGLLAGLAGLSTTLLLRFLEHLTYHYTFGSLLEAVTGSSPVRRALGPMVGGALAGLG
ncbi:MAG: chloride ion channel protein, partial [Mycobacterium sp.]